MIQKFSTKQPSAETKLKVLKEIASENGIPLHLEQESPIIIKVRKYLFFFFNYNEKKHFIHMIVKSPKHQKR